MGFSSAITLQELKDFHNIDRQVYKRLVLGLGMEPQKANKVVAFWVFLERKGFKNFVRTIQSLPIASLGGLANEAIMCIDCLSCLSQELLLRVEVHVPLMRRLVGLTFSLGLVFHDKESAKRSIDDFVNDVCEKAFGDLVFPKTLADGVGCPESNGGVQCQSPKGEDVMEVSEEDVDSVPQNDRTLFITFSKGHPITKQELKDLITGKFGNCVEAVYMRIHPQPLFARVVLNSLSDVSEILGDKKLVKFSVNGRDVWARRFVSKGVEQSQTEKKAAD